MRAGVAVRAPKAHSTTSAVSTATTVGSVRLANPVCTASGTAGRSLELDPYMDLASLGAFVTKSLSAVPWPGNPAPRLVPSGEGMLNSVGLQGPGVQAWLERDLPGLCERGITTVVSIWGRTVEEFAMAATMLGDAPSSVVAVEANVSCPNLEDRRKMFAHSPSATAEVVEACLGAKRPVWAKLSPNVSDIAEIAAAARGAGAEAVVLVNTLLAMAIDVTRRRPHLGGVGGGLSGRPLHAVAVRAVWDVWESAPGEPIIGVGGVWDANSALELILAGASAIQVGTASFLDPAAAVKVLEAMVSFCEGEGVGSVAELVGEAHR